MSTLKNLYKNQKLSFASVHRVAIHAYAKAPPPLSSVSFSPVTEYSVGYHLILNGLEFISLKDASDRQLDIIKAMAEALSKLQIAENAKLEKQQRAASRQKHKKVRQE